MSGLGRLRRAVFVPLVLLLLAVAAGGPLQAQVVLPAGFGSLSLARGVGFQVVEAAPTDEELLRLSPDSFDTRRFPSAPSLGFTGRTLLVRIPFRNESGRTEFFLQTGLPRHGYSRAVFGSGGVRGMQEGQFTTGAQVTGAELPFYSRPVVANRPTFHVHIPRGESELRLIMRSQDALSAPLDLHTVDEFRLQQDQEHLWYGLLFAALLIIGLYNLLIFLSVRDWSYLQYALLTFSACLYFGVVSGYTRRVLWPDAVSWDLRAAVLVVGAYLFFIVLFGRTFLKTRSGVPVLDRALLVLQWCAPPLAFWVLVVPLGRVSPFVMVLALASILTLVAAAVILALRRSREARFFLAAFSLFALGAVTFVLRVAGIFPVNFFTVHGIQIGSVAELLLLSLALADRVRVLQREVQSRMSDLERAHRDLERSEKRYRHLVQGTRDIIFVLDRKFHFESLNDSSWNLLGRDPREFVGTSFREALYETERERSFVGVIVDERLHALSRGEKVQFTTEWRTRRAEGRTMNVLIEPIAMEGETIYLGRASPGDEDALLPYLTSERARFVVTNYFGIGELLGDRLTRNLRRYVSQDLMLDLRLGVREVLINAIEHGNLNVTGREKAAALEAGTYFAFLQERQADPRFRDRTVTVDYSLSPRRVWFRITDQGEGFDHRAMLQKTLAEVNEASSLHGRGILLARQYFDVLRYNEKGNEVLLIKTL